MGYTPQILINRTDLETRMNALRPMAEKKGAKQVAYKMIIDAFDHEDIIEFPRLSLIIIHPDLTELNARVRHILSAFDVEFRVAN